MKKILFLSLVLHFGGASNAQTITYQPLHGNYTQYLNRYQYWDGSQMQEAFSKTVWSGDTTIGGQNYVRIFRNGNYAGGIREDVPNQQRFFVDVNNVEKDITIPHFLTAGTYLTDSSKFMNAFRTYFQYFDGNYDTLQVSQVDSILEADGTYSATYHLRKLPQPNTFVYNTYRGILHYQKLEFTVEQVCYREDGEQTPPGQETPWTLFCDLGMEESHAIQVELFPNPAAEYLNLSGDLSQITDLTVYDMRGIEVQQIPLSEIHSPISLSELNAGIYLLSVNRNAQVIRFRKQ